MRCADVERLWDEMREGVEPQREHVLAHLHVCPECQEIYRENEGIAYCLTCLPPVDPPQSLVPKILDHIKLTVKIVAPDSITTVESVGPPSVSRVGRKITYGRRLTRMMSSARVMSSNIFLCVARVMTERSSDTPCACIALSPAPSQETKMNRLRDLMACSSGTRFRTQAVITGLDEPMADRTNRHPSTAL